MVCTLGIGNVISNLTPCVLYHMLITLFGHWQMIQLINKINAYKHYLFFVGGSLIWYCIFVIMVSYLYHISYGIVSLLKCNNKNTIFILWYTNTYLEKLMTIYRYYKSKHLHPHTLCFMAPSTCISKVCMVQLIYTWNKDATCIFNPFWVNMYNDVNLCCSHVIIIKMYTKLNTIHVLHNLLLQHQLI